MVAVGGGVGRADRDVVGHDPAFHGHEHLVDGAAVPGSSGADGDVRGVGPLGLGQGTVAPRREEGVEGGVVGQVRRGGHALIH
jgi:hypothetical protein